MNTLLAKLPAFALPFVTRSLRGGRGKGYASISLLIAVATLLMGLWLALGSGSFEQSVRVEVGLENDEWTRQQNEFVVLTHNSHAFAQAIDEVEQLKQREVFAVTDKSYSEVAEIHEHGLQLLSQAAGSATRDPSHIELRQQARQLLDPQQTMQWTDHERFAWHDRHQLAALERVIERQAIPEVRRYQSPLGWTDALQFVGMLAGAILAACATVFGPLLVAVQQAQERHENTLMPLTGTALSPRELALGLAAGPSSVALIFAAPQLLLYVGCALLVGKVMVAASFLVALAATGLFMTFAAQLLGHVVGQRRTPGIVAIALMCILGVTWLVGAGTAVEADLEIAGLAAVIPTLGLSTLLAESFGDHAMAYFATLHTATLAWSLAALVFAGLTLTVLSHKLEGRQGAPLRPSAALLGALTCIGLVNLAMPVELNHEQGARMYLGLAGLALPFTVLLMARVPVGEEPARMRRVPVGKLLAEFASWGAAHVVVALALTTAPLGHSLHPVALAWLSWCVVTLGLIAIRMVSYPATILALLFIGFCSASLFMGYAQALYWVIEDKHVIGDVFVMNKISVVLGLVQVAVTVGVPVLLLRSLRKNLGSLCSK